jgi:hypothetical protein
MFNTNTNTIYHMLNLFFTLATEDTARPIINGAASQLGMSLNLCVYRVSVSLFVFQASFLIAE